MSSKDWILDDSVQVHKVWGESTESSSLLQTEFQCLSYLQVS